MMNHREGLNSDNVRVGVSGAIYSAPRYTQPVGSDGFGEIASAVNLGYASEDGITETIEQSSEKLKGWQDNDQVRTLITEDFVKYSFTLIETKREVLELYYGIKFDNNGIMLGTGKKRERQAIIIDVVDGEDIQRIFLPDAEVEETGDQTFANGEAIAYEITITGYKTDIGGTAGAAKKFFNKIKAEDTDLSV